MTEHLIDWFTWFIYRLTDWLEDWLICLLTQLLIGWLIDWFIHSFNHCLTPQKTVLAKLVVPNLAQKFCGTQKLMKMFVRNCSWSLNSARKFQSSLPHSRLWELREYRRLVYWNHETEIAAYRQLRTRQRGFGVTSPVADTTTGYTRRVPVRQIVVLYMWQNSVLSIVNAVGSILFYSLRLILNAIVHRGVAIHCNKCVDFEWKRGFLSRLPDNEHTAKFSHGLSTVSTI